MTDTYFIRFGFFYFRIHKFFLHNSLSVDSFQHLTQNTISLLNILAHLCPISQQKNRITPPTRRPSLGLRCTPRLLGMSRHRAGIAIAARPELRSTADAPARCRPASCRQEREGSPSLAASAGSRPV